MPRAPSSGLGSTLGTGTPHSSRRSITSDYDTSSILDSASMYGGDEPSTPSPPVRSQVQQQPQHREVYVGDELPPRSNSTRRKSKEPSASATLPTIITTKINNDSPPPVSTEHSRSFSITGDDIEAAFDAVNDYKTTVNDSSSNKYKEYEASSPDSLFGLSTIKEATDTDELVLGTALSSRHNDAYIDDIDFDNCFNQYKQQQEKEKKKSAPPTPVTQKPPKHQEIKQETKQESKQEPRREIRQDPKPEPKRETKQETKSSHNPKEQKRQAPVHTDDTSTSSMSKPISKVDIITTPAMPVSITKPVETVPSTVDDPDDSIDEDVDELLGKLEVSIYPSLLHTHTYRYTYTR